MYVAYLAHLGSRVLIPDAVGIQETADGFTVHFVDEAGKVLVSFRRQDVAMHGPEAEIPEEPFATK
jgi:hypothetical protein